MGVGDLLEEDDEPSSSSNNNNQLEQFLQKWQEELKQKTHNTATEQHETTVGIYIPLLYHSPLNNQLLIGTDFQKIVGCPYSEMKSTSPDRKRPDLRCTLDSLGKRSYSRHSVYHRIFLTNGLHPNKTSHIDI